IRALSVRQPFASAILAGQKTEEYRTWSTTHRGLLAIHASGPPVDGLPVGVILGTVELVGCLEDVYEQFVLLLANPCPLARPVPAPGRLGLWWFDLTDGLPV